MSEYEIERRVERAIDRLDAAYMAGEVNGLEYDLLFEEIKVWAREQYERL